MSDLNKALRDNASWLDSKGKVGKRFVGVEHDLIGANLSRTNLIAANLSGANLSGANLSRANLFEASLISANLTDANLSTSNLIDANLSRANLTYANLTDADLTCADLTCANLTYANIRYCKGNGKEIKNIDGYEYNIVICGDQVAAGCQQHSIEDWRKILCGGKEIDISKQEEQYMAKHGNEILAKVEGLIK